MDDQVVDVADDSFKRTGRIDDVAVGHRLDEGAIAIALTPGFLEGDFSFSRLDHFGGSVEADNQVRLGRNRADEAQDPIGAAVAVALVVDDRVEEIAVVDVDAAAAEGGIDRDEV